MLRQHIDISDKVLQEFSRRWNVHELALFGSVLRPDFRLDSDIDVLVTFNDTAEWGLFALVQMQQELEQIFGRPVDLVSRRGIEASSNWLRRDEILKTAQAIYSDTGKQEVSNVA